MTTSGPLLLTSPRLPQAPAAWLALVGVALIGTVVAATTFFAALALLGPSDTAVFSTVEPVVSVAVAGLVLGEQRRPLQADAGAVVLRRGVKRAAASLVAARFQSGRSASGSHR